MKSIPGEVDRLKQIVDENPQSTQFARLAEYLLQMNRIPEAIEVCKNGMDNHPNYPNAHFVLGQCYFKTQEFDSAESEFNKVLLHDPEHVQAHHLQAKIMKERGWSNAYLLWLKRALSVDPLDKLSQSLIDDYSEEEMELEKDTILEQETYETSEETIVAEPYFDEESKIAVDEVETKIETTADTDVDLKTDEIEEEVKLATEETKDEVELSSFDDEKLVEEEVGGESEADDKRYEYIIDDIFKDEVSSDESLEILEEEIESYETPEEIIDETEDVAEEVSEEIVEEKTDKIVEEQLEDEEEIVAQIRDKVEQFEDDEKAAQEFPTEFEEQIKDVEEPGEDTFAEEIKPEISEEVEDEIPELITPEQVEKDVPELITSEEVLKEETVFDEEKSDLDVQETEVKEASQFEEEISTLDRERAAREVFGDDDEVVEEPTEATEEESEFKFQSEEPVEETFVQAEEDVAIEETPFVSETPEEEQSASSNKDPIVTSTLGEIYAAQGHFTKAIGVYEILQKKNPDNPVYKQKIEELNKKQEEAEQEE